MMMMMMMIIIIKRRKTNQTLNDRAELAAKLYEM
jgi:hypothetical protein